MNSFRREFNSASIVLSAVAIALNVIVGQIARVSELTLYLDSIGTVLVGVLVGPWAGALTGFLSNVAWSLTGLFPQAIALAGGAAIIGALAGVFGRAGWTRKWWRAALAGLIAGIVAAALSAPIVAYVFGGVIGAGPDALVGFFRDMGMNVLGANLAQAGISHSVDKIVTFLVVWAVLLVLPRRLAARFAVEKPRE